MQTRLSVFLNNKTITAETAVPVIFKFRDEHQNSDIKFFVPSYLTLQQIEKNHLLSSALNELGPIYLLSFSENWKHRNFRSFLKVLFELAVDCAVAIVNRTVFFHFKQLSTFPWRVLYLLNRKNTILWQPNASGMPKSAELVQDLVERRKRSVMPICAGGIGYVDQHWSVANDPTFKKVEKVKISKQYTPRSYYACLDRIAKKVLAAHGLQKEALRHHGVIYLVGGGGFGGSSGDVKFVKGGSKGMTKLLISNVQILRKVFKDQIIYYKPHPNLSQDQIEQIRIELKDFNVQIGNCHFLAMLPHIILALGTHPSNLLAAMMAYGVTVVESSNYEAHVLVNTENRSSREDWCSYFINNNPKKLNQILREIRSSRRIIYPSLLNYYEQKVIKNYADDEKKLSNFFGKF